MHWNEEARARERERERGQSESENLVGSLVVNVAEARKANLRRTGFSACASRERERED